MPTWVFRFLDGVTEVHTFEWMAKKEMKNGKKINTKRVQWVKEMLYVTNSWKESRGILVPQQTVITRRSDGLHRQSRIFQERIR